MESAFWHEKWANDEIGFHRPEVHPLLTRHWSRVSSDHQARVFVPLCGKSLDLGYLMSMGHQVIGVELDERPVREFFQEQNLEPEVTEWRNGQCWAAPGVVIYQGDFFELQQADLGEIGAVYDRGSLIALPPPMRALYATRLSALTSSAPQLLITLEYDQNSMDGPPFSVASQEVEQRYGDRYAIEELSRENIIEREERFQDKLERLDEVAWLLQPRQA